MYYVVTLIMIEVYMLQFYTTGVLDHSCNKHCNLIGRLLQSHRTTVICNNVMGSYLKVSMNLLILTTPITCTHSCTL